MIDVGRSRFSSISLLGHPPFIFCFNYHLYTQLLFRLSVHFGHGSSSRLGV